MSEPEEPPDAPDGQPTLALVLAVLRVAHGLNQEQWSQAADVRAASISSYERGKLEPSHKMIGRLLAALGLPYAALDLAQVFLADLRVLADEEGPVGAGETAPAGGGGARLSREIEVLATDAGKVVRSAVRLLFQTPALWRAESPAAPGAEAGWEEPEDR